MKRRRHEPERSTERTKEKLEAAAKRAFAKHGFHGATVQQIAQDAGMNISLISHHFGGKLGLYRACLSHFSQQRLLSLDRFMSPSKTEAEFRAKLNILVGELLDQHLAEPEVLAILLRDISDAELMGNELEHQLYDFTGKLARVFEDAKARGFLRRGVDPLVAARMLYLAFAGLIQFSAHVERVGGIVLADAATRRGIIDKVLDILFNGIMKT